MRQSKYAALSFLISSVGENALRAADGDPVSHGGPGDTRLVFPKNTRLADRKARLLARRLKEVTGPTD
jgi:hypothetical protein